VRALANAIGKTVSFAAFAAIVIALYMTGANVYGYFADGPGTPVDQSQAAVAKRADATLYPDSLRESARCLASRRRSSGEINVDEYRWYRGAIRVRAAGDIPIRVEIDDNGWFDILPFGRPNFPGTFLDLKIGGPAPSPEATAALRKRAVECCQAALLKWGESGGRVSWIDYQRKVLRLPGH
jgi:hypothetical protein